MCTVLFPLLFISITQLCKAGANLLFTHVDCTPVARSYAVSHLKPTTNNKCSTSLIESTIPRTHRSAALHMSVHAKRHTKSAIAESANNKKVRFSHDLGYLSIEPPDCELTKTPCRRRSLTCWALLCCSRCCYFA